MNLKNDAMYFKKFEQVVLEEPMPVPHAKRVNCYEKFNLIAFY